MCLWILWYLYKLNSSAILTNTNICVHGLCFATLTVTVAEPCSEFTEVQLFSVMSETSYLLKHWVAHTSYFMNLGEVTWPLSEPKADCSPISKSEPKAGCSPINKSEYIYNSLILLACIHEILFKWNSHIQEVWSFGEHNQLSNFLTSKFLVFVSKKSTPKLPILVQR